MHYDNLPIYKSALDFCVYIETIVKNFDRYSRYSIGEDLRSYSKELLFLIHRANRTGEKKEAQVCNLIWSSITKANNSDNIQSNSKHVRCVRGGE